MDPEVKEWFLTLHAAMSHQRKWGMSRTLRFAKAICPELFLHLHPDTPRKWHAECRPRGGSESSLSPGVVSQLCCLAERVTKVVLVSAGVMRVIFHVQLCAFGVDKTMSIRTVQRFLAVAGMKYRQKGCAPKRFTQEQADDAIRNVMLKLAFTMDKWDIPADRIYNLDETSCRMLCATT